MGEALGGQFGSQALKQLQDYSNLNGGIFGGGTGVSPLGAVEPFNQQQQNALQSFGSGLSGLQNELPGYQNLYNQNVLDPELANIDRLHQQGQNQLRSNQLLGTGGQNAFSNSAFGTQLAGLQDTASRLRMDARAGAFQGGQNLRRQTLQDMLNSGGAIQNQNQSLLNYLQPQLQQATPQAQSQNFAAGLSQFPQTQISSGQASNPNPGTPNFWSKLGGGAQAALGVGQTLGGSGGFGGFGNGFGGFGGGSNMFAGVNAPPPPAPGTYRPYGNRYLNNPF
jgi:hypothetical protein